MAIALLQPENIQQMNFRLVFVSFVQMRNMLIWEYLSSNDMFLLADDASKDSCG